MIYLIIGDRTKKGFTLIQLLAVILILGIIALIAIPTVNKIINLLSTRTSSTPGALTLTEDNNIDISLLNNKYWNIVN